MGGKPDAELIFTIRFFIHFHSLAATVPGSFLLCLFLFYFFFVIFKSVERLVMNRPECLLFGIISFCF